MKKSKKIISRNLIILVLISSFALTFNFVSARGPTDDSEELTSGSTGKSITDQMKDAITSVDLPSAAEEGQAEEIAGGIISVFLSIFGIVFFSLMVYGGYKWMIAQGREEEVKKAKEIIRNAIIGLGVVFLAYAISVFVIQRFGQATGFDPGATETTTEEEP